MSDQRNVDMTELIASMQAEADRLAEEDAQNSSFPGHAAWLCLFAALFFAILFALSTWARMQRHDREIEELRREVGAVRELVDQ